jgi:prepilin-type N-terminal cleavage/methylation domain-containing protein/prepilin-type processing-associated H-X9-DG protein
MGTRHRKISPLWSRPGITLIEVLVTIGIIGILFSLLLPAIAASRGAATKTQCISNMRQIGQALTAYESVNNRLPDFFFHRDLLPFIEYAPLYEEMEVGRPFTDDEWRRFSAVSIPLYRCPTDPAPEMFEIAEGMSAVGTNYVGNLSWHRPNVRHPLHLAELINGESHSPIVSETLRANHDSLRMRAVWAIAMNTPNAEGFLRACESLPDDPEAFGYQIVGYRGAPWHANGVQGIRTFYDHQLPPNRPNCKGYNFSGFTYPAMSMHAGGVHVVYADGHIDFVSQSIDRSLWKSSGRLTRRSIF